MPPDGEPLVDQQAATRTGLRGERRRHGYHRLSSVCCFERQDAQEPAPSSVRNGLRQMVILEHVGRLQVFVIDGVVLAYEGERRLVMEVLPLAPHCLMRFGEQFDRLLTTLTAFLTA